MVELLLIAAEEAQHAAEAGDRPFGCVVADFKGNELVRARNTVNSSRNIGAHAELNALAELGSLRDRPDGFDDCAFFINADPCFSCVRLMLASGVRMFVVGSMATGLMVEPIGKVVNSHWPEPVIHTRGLLGAELGEQLYYLEAAGRAESQRLREYHLQVARRMLVLTQSAPLEEVTIPWVFEGGKAFEWMNVPGAWRSTGIGE